MHHLSGGHAQYLLLFGPHHGGDAADVRFVRPHAGERKENVSLCMPSTVNIGKFCYFSIFSTD
ncbi:hypothetical protein WJR50_19930 [Catalinimonas sp. 4WD22]|uniref:hypothetical protein n=1 Tax=Catalinimonas locisalis TaxID=3133978 RepID=UPI003101AB0B